MDALEGTILAYTRRDAFDDLAELLDKQQDLIAANLVALFQLANRLNHADVKVHPTTGIVCVLATRLLVQPTISDTREAELFLKNFELLVKDGDYTQQLAGREQMLIRFNRILAAYVQSTTAVGSYRRCLFTLRQVIDKFAPSHEHLTAAHVHLLEVALRFNIPIAANPIISRAVLEVDPLQTGVRLREYCLYFYYSSMIHLAYRRWAEALECATIAISVPGVGNSGVMIAAARLYLLLGVIHTGKLLPIGGSMLDKYVRVISPVYAEYAAACEAQNFQLMSQLETLHAQEFALDGLAGLVQQIRGFVLRQAVKALTKVYVTLSIDDIAHEVGLDEANARHLLLTMIEEGEVVATVDRSNTVKFFDQPSVTAVEVEGAISTAQRSLKRLEEADRRVSLATPYLAEKLRSMPNFIQLMEDYETKQKNAKGVLGRLTELVTK